MSRVAPITGTRKQVAAAKRDLALEAGRTWTRAMRSGTSLGEERQEALLDLLAAIKSWVDAEEKTR